jgi:hypothetical protein
MRIFRLAEDPPNLLEVACRHQHVRLLTYSRFPSASPRTNAVRGSFVFRSMARRMRNAFAFSLRGHETIEASTSEIPQVGLSETLRIFV